MAAHPLAREADLVVEELGEELLVFDRRRQRAHSLNPVAARVWRACNGARSPERIAEHCGLDRDAVGLALEALADIELLQAPLTAGDDASPAVSRRQMLRRAAVTGVGIGIAIPVIRSINAPTAQAATSTCKGRGQACPNFSSCCAGLSCGSAAVCCPSRGSSCPGGKNASCCGGAVCHAGGVCFGVSCQATGSSCSGTNQCCFGLTCKPNAANSSLSCQAT